MSDEAGAELSPDINVGGFWPKRLMMDLILIVIVVLFLNFFIS